MADDDINQLKEEIRRLHERTQETKSTLKTTVVLADTRHASLVEAISKLTEHYENLNEDIKELSKKVEQLNMIATTGKASIRTLLIIGALISSLVAIVASIKGSFF